MSLYALRKKIQDDLAETENTISIIEPTTQINELHVAHGAKFITERILEWINKEIIEIESRVSQLEEEIKERYTKEGPQDWERELLINKELDTLRGVVGK